MLDVLEKTFLDLRHLFTSDNFSYFSMGGLLGVATYTTLQEYIMDTGLRILSACLIAFFGGIFGVIGKESWVVLKSKFKKWTSKK